MSVVSKHPHYNYPKAVRFELREKPIDEILTEILVKIAGIEARLSYLENKDGYKERQI